MIDTLIKALMEANLQAKVAPEATETGVPPKVRWYQLVGYLVQVLHDVFKRAPFGEYTRKCRCKTQCLAQRILTQTLRD